MVRDGRREEKEELWLWLCRRGMCRGMWLWCRGGGMSRGLLLFSCTLYVLGRVLEGMEGIVGYLMFSDMNVLCLIGKMPLLSSIFIRDFGYLNEGNIP